MNIYSLDTNLVIALLNDKDRLHLIANKIIKKEKDDCVIFKSVLKETAKVYRNKLMRVTNKIFPILWKINVVENSMKRNEILLQEFKKLIKLEPQLKNFYELLFKKMMSYIERVGMRTLPRYLSDLSENYTRTIDAKLKDIVVYDIMFVDYDNEGEIKKLAKIKKTILSIKFSDSNDFEIFCEIVIKLSKLSIIYFYTDDNKFCKQGKKAYCLLEKNLDYNANWLKLIHTSDLTK